MMTGENRNKTCGSILYLHPILALSDFFLRDRTKQAGGSEKKY